MVCVMIGMGWVSVGLCQSCSKIIQALLESPEGIVVSDQKCHSDKELIFWIRAKKGSPDLTFQEIAQFILTHPHWPQLHILQRRAEEKLNDDVLSQFVIAFFQKRAPLTYKGRFAYIKALHKAQGPQKSEKILREFWHQGYFTRDEEKKVLEQFSSMLGPADHHVRIESLIWGGKAPDVKQVMQVPKSFQGVAAVCAQFLMNDPEAEKNYKTLSSLDQKKEIVQLAYGRWLKKQEDLDRAFQFFLKVPKSQTRLRYWSKEILYMAREMLQQNNPKAAYRLLTLVRVPEQDPSYVDFQWVSGWVALRFLQNPKKAQEHFENFCKIVKRPISLARAYYWLGRAWEAQGEMQKAHFFYNKASPYKITFYGQLASLKLGQTPFPTFCKKFPVSEQEHDLFQEKDLVKAIWALKPCGPQASGAIYQFLEALAVHVRTKPQKLLTLNLASVVHNHATADLARNLQDWQGDIIEAAYPVLPLPEGAEGLCEHALVLSVIHRETRFNQDVGGAAGEKGLMQLMPKTAVELAKNLGLDHDPSKLLLPEYSMLLGMNYLYECLKIFNGNYVLAIGAYNAGFGSVQKWLAGWVDNGPSDVIDLIESIPYHGTRDYVMRVLENVTIYRGLLGQTQSHLVLDLQR